MVNKNNLAYGASAKKIVNKSGMAKWLTNVMLRSFEIGDLIKSQYGVFLYQSIALTRFYLQSFGSNPIRLSGQPQSPAETMKRAVARVSFRKFVAERFVASSPSQKRKCTTPQ